MTPEMSVGLRAPVPHCERNLSGEGRVECQQSVIKGYHCKPKEEMYVFKNSRCVLQLCSISNLIIDS